MGKHVLITGGAGFIGSHLAGELLASGYSVRALDNLSPQVHGAERRRPAYLNSEVELIVGDIRDRQAVRRALRGVDTVCHLAALVGVGQSMYEIAPYTDVNNLGTATLLQELSERPVERLIVASSMSLYGEGLYRSPDGKLVGGVERSLEQLKSGDWEVRDAAGEMLTPVPTPETKSPSLASVYALSKYYQECLCLLVGRAYNIPTVALRFFNVFGTRQAVSNPYTGVLAIFASRFLNGNPPLIYEDGLQQRDFVSVHDVAQACRLALEVPEAAGQVFNIGSGRSYMIREIAERMAAALGKPHLEPEISGRYRVGDVRHCFADITRARQVLGYEPRVSLEEGLQELAIWLEGQQAIDRVDEASAALAVRGLTLGSSTSSRPRPVAVMEVKEDADGPESEDETAPDKETTGDACHNQRDYPPGRRPARAPKLIYRLSGKGGADGMPGATWQRGPSRLVRRRRPALITGGAGFIGTNLAHRLLSSGRSVILFDNLSRPGAEQNLQWLRETHGDLVQVEVADIRDKHSLARSVRRAAQVFHFAAQVAVTSSLVEPLYDFEVNARGTLNLLEALRALNDPPPLVYTSTNKVYGGLEDVKLSQTKTRYKPEDDAIGTNGVSELRPLDFRSPYGCSKGAADQYVSDYARTYSLPAVTFRMSCIYGPHQFGTEDQGWMAYFLIRALEGRPLTIYGDGKQVRDVLFVEDLIDALLIAQKQMELLTGQSFNLGGGPLNTISLNELIDLIGELHGRRPDVSYAEWRVGDQRYYVCDTRKFQDATGWRPQVGVREGVTMLYQWLRETRGMIPLRTVARKRSR